MMSHDHHDRPTSYRPMVFLLILITVVVLYRDFGPGAATRKALDVIHDNPDSFTLTISQYPPKSVRRDPTFELYSVLLYASDTIRIEPSAIGPSGKPIGEAYHLTPVQLERVLDHLDHVEFFDDATPGLPRHSAPYGMIDISFRREGQAEPTQYGISYDWGPTFLKAVRALRDALGDGEAADALDRIIAQFQARLP